MRKYLALMGLAIAAVLAGGLAAQSNGLAVSSVIHEPTGTEVGANIEPQTILNPDYDLGPPPRGVEFLPVWGNGRGLGTSGELHARGGTTTHDLVFFVNNGTADITIDTSTLALSTTAPKYDNPQKPEATQPGWRTPPVIYEFDLNPILIQVGATAALFMVRTQWKSMLDTSPRDYIFTFEMLDTTSSTTLLVDVPLTIPTGDDDGGGCISTGNGAPHGLVLLLASGLFALARRRRRNGYAL